MNDLAGGIAGAFVTLDEDLERDSAQAYDVEAVRRVALAQQIIAVLENPVLRTAGDLPEMLL